MKILKGWLYFGVVLLFLVMGLPLLLVTRPFQSSDEDRNILKDGTVIRLLRNDKNTIQKLPLEEYIKGVVAAEMPADFEEEALKAQAVAARTYAYGRMVKRFGAKDTPHPDADICSDSSHCQAWSDFTEVYKNASQKNRKLWEEKISSAVESTRGEILKYNGEVANPLFHSNSGGMTENAADVFDADVPYLKAVASFGEEESKEFSKTYEFTWQEFADRIKKEYPDIEFTPSKGLGQIEVMQKSKSERVKTIRIGNRICKGTDIRRIFSLRSTNFVITGNQKKVVFTVLGNGHGVGMSQWGANYLAKSGGRYKEILKYYYTGIEMGKI